MKAKRRMRNLKQKLSRLLTPSFVLDEKTRNKLDQVLDDLRQSLSALRKQGKDTTVAQLELRSLQARMKVLYERPSKEGLHQAQNLIKQIRHHLHQIKHEREEDIKKTYYQEDEDAP